MDEDTMKLIAKVRSENESNERAQVEQVFGLTGGELMDDVWVPMHDIRKATNTLTECAPITFTYWYEGLPDYVDRRDTDWRDGTYRTVIRDETFGQVPETVTDDEGTWKVVVRYTSSGETQCPYEDADEVPKVDPCPLCENPYPLHGYIYIGDGWAEIVYRLDSQPITPRPCMHNGYHQPGECPEANAS